MFNKIKKRKEIVDSKRQFDIFLEPKEVPDGMFEKCPKCDQIYEISKLKDNLRVCSHCDYHHRMHIAERILSTFDEFKVFNHVIKSVDPLEFPNYRNKLENLTDELGVYDAVVCGEAKIGSYEVIGVVMDSYFMMGSMGTVVGEKITRSFERALKQKKPIIVFSASGGARMQEGLLSLMQMAKTSGAVGKFHQQNGLFINVLTDPTTGGVTASFSMLADIIIAEPKALIGFAGPRVIEQTIRQPLPDGFQRSEFLLEKGFVDQIVHRHNMKESLRKILELHEVKS